MESKKQVVVVSLPGESDQQYYGFHKHLADIYIEMDHLTEGRDHLFILHDKSGRWYLNRHEFRNAHLIEVDPSLDMWMRDFPPTVPELQVKFKYKPGYIKSSQAKKDQAAFDVFAEQVELPSFDNCNIVLEGGNIVDNGKDIALVSERVFKDNKGMSKATLTEKLESAIKRKVIYIPDPEDTTGHSDGVVSFVEEDVLLVAYYEDDKEYFEMIEHEVRKAFGDQIKVVPLPCYEVKKKSHGFGSSEGSYANTLVTNNAVYVPMFSNQASNRKALETFQRSAKKDVVPVPGLDKVAKLGGSIRCMSWQIDQDHPIAKKLFQYVEGSGSDVDDHDDGDEEH